MQLEREKFLQELEEEKKLRTLVRKSIRMIKERKEKANIKTKLEEQKLRHYIRLLIKEASTDVAAEVPHQNTGINILGDLLKKIIPVIEDDYKALTSNDEQRRSFRSHVLRAIMNSLAPDNALRRTDSEAPAVAAIKEDIEIDVRDEDKFIPVRQQDVEPEEPEEEDEFTIQGEDTTGRNFALQTYNKVEKSVLDAYESLADDEDRELFYDYLLTNVKLYFDKFEDELKTSLKEPTTDAYEAEKEAEAAEEATQEYDTEEGENEAATELGL